METKLYVVSGAPLTYDDILKRSEGRTVKTIEQCEKFTVLNVDGVKVETGDRKIGWIGGFHMVWD